MIRLMFQDTTVCYDHDRYRCVYRCLFLFFQDKVKLWLSTVLKKEEESWLKNNTPEIIDTYYFSPLAVDVIQVR